MERINHRRSQQWRHHSRFWGRFFEEQQSRIALWHEKHDKSRGTTIHAAPCGGFFRKSTWRIHTHTLTHTPTEVPDGPSRSLGQRLMAKTAGSNCTINHHRFTEGFLSILLRFSSAHTFHTFRKTRNNGFSGAPRSPTPTLPRKHFGTNTYSGTETTRTLVATVAATVVESCASAHMYAWNFSTCNTLVVSVCSVFCLLRGQLSFVSSCANPKPNRAFGEKIDTQSSAARLKCSAASSARNRISICDWRKSTV